MKIASIYRKCIPASFENTFQIFAQQILIKILYNLPHDIYFKYFKKLRQRGQACCQNSHNQWENWKLNLENLAKEFWANNTKLLK